MTDKWDEIALELAMKAPPCVSSTATALRSAYLAGLMKAGAIATLEPHPDPQNDWYTGYEVGRNEAARDIYSEATAIRAAKETKE